MVLCPINAVKGGLLMIKKIISLTVNEDQYNFSVGENYGQLPPNETLIETLRNRLDLTGAKLACDEGACGCCTVVADENAVLSCMMLTVECDGMKITTIEGLRDRESGELAPLQQAFIKENAFQCGYCTPGIIMAAKALLDKRPNPTRDEVAEALSGNYCRCISQYAVFDAISELSIEKRA
jgi:carbon-monoxide dehydrogenase small subunit